MTTTTPSPASAFTVTVKIVPEWQTNYGFDFDEVLVVVGSETRNGQLGYNVQGRKYACWIEAQQLRLAHGAT